MKFSEIQTKEVIDKAKGTFLGYVQDATIDIANGKIKTLHVSDGDRFFLFDSKQKKEHEIYLENVTIIGKDIVLVDEKDGRS